jgi:predicted short-subunit dehydrogenase-like oxidoreductase (DUF2520 family)
MKHPTNVAIIGAGRLGTALAMALSEQDYVVSAVVSRTLKSAKRTARMLPRPATALDVSQLSSLTVPDLLLITTPDDQIKVVAQALESLQLAKRQKPVALHTSGALSSTVLSTLAKRGWEVGSLHPLLSISDLKGEMGFAGAYWCIEGQPLAQRRAKALVRSLKGNSFSIGLEYKALYHASAVMSSGSVVALFAAAIEMLMACGLPRGEAKEVLMPLLESTVRSLEDKEPGAALTGPFARGDFETIKLHLDALRKVHKREIEDLYRVLGKRSLELARVSGLDSKKSKKIKSIL